MAIPNLLDRERDPDSPQEQDRRDQGAVLSVLIDEHPTRLTTDELVLVLHADPDLADPGDAAIRAISELIGAGLLHRDGRFLAPSRAALNFAALEVA